MGALTSRQNARVEEVDVAGSHAYHYPPKSGSYFGNHFIMGGERFDTPQPEAYLFGENADLNFLGNKPTPFPYPAPQANEPTKTLRSLINIQKESLRFVKAPDDNNGGSLKIGSSELQEKSQTRYNIEFTFDSDIRCAITIHYFCVEEITPSRAIYTPRDVSMNSETYHYKSGANQQFVQVSHVFDPSNYSDEELNYSFEKEIMPVVIQCVAEEGDDPKQSHMTVAVVEKNSDGSYSLKALKQKQFVDGLCYLIQEIYGIENKNAEYPKATNEDEVEDNGSECVICMCDIRDTLILPCRHLCLCNCCADSLRYQANNCPICRAPFRALLQIRALRKVTGPNQISAGDGSQIPKTENIPHGYEAISLIEALNGIPAHVNSTLPTSGLQLPTAPVLPIVPPLCTEMTVSLPVMQQDAYTSPAMPVPVDSANCRNFTGSFSSMQVAATMEDCAAQTDCPLEVVPVSETVDTLTPEICLSVMLPNSPEKGAEGCVHATKTKRLSRSRNFSLDKVVVLKNDDSYVDVEKNCPSDDQTSAQRLGEAQSLIEICAPLRRTISKSDKSVSLSTPDSLHFCEQLTNNSAAVPVPSNGQTILDASPGGEESDYYTPEDPNTTILSEQQQQQHNSSQTEDGAVCISTAGSDDIEVRDGDSDVIVEEEDGTPLKGFLPTYIEAISLPGTPLSHSSNRSSGDSFSSMSSTRLLLPNQSHEMLAKDRML